MHIPIPSVSRAWRHIRRLAPLALQATLGSAAQAGLVTYDSPTQFTPLLAPGFYLEQTWAGITNGVTSSAKSLPMKH